MSIYNIRNCHPKHLGNIKPFYPSTADIIIIAACHNKDKS